MKMKLPTEKTINVPNWLLALLTFYTIACIAFLAALSYLLMRIANLPMCI